VWKGGGKPECGHGGGERDKRDRVGGGKYVYGYHKSIVTVIARHETVNEKIGEDVVVRCKIKRKM
jgi:hypothetical protein